MESPLSGKLLKGECNAGDMVHIDGVDDALVFERAEDATLDVAQSVEESLDA